MRLSVTKEDASGMQKILAFFRGEVVLTAALVLALLSFLLTPPSAAAFAGLARFMLSSEAGAVPLPMDAEALEAVGDEIARRRMGAMQP